MLTTVAPTIGSLPREAALHFVCGMPGFEQYTAYTLTSIEGTPVYWLRCDEEPALALPLAEPFALDPAYSFELSTADVAALGLEQPDDALVLVALTIPRQGATVTANLFAPVVVNRRTWRAKQVILDGSTYALRHPVETIRGSGQ